MGSEPDYVIHHLGDNVIYTNVPWPYFWMLSNLFPSSLLMWHDKYFLSPQQVSFSLSWRGSLDAWQPLPVACFMAFICRHIMTGSSGFQLDRWAAGVLWLCSSYVFVRLPARILSGPVFFFVKGARARTHLSGRQWPLLLLLQAYADSAIVWTR